MSSLKSGAAACAIDADATVSSQFSELDLVERCVAGEPVAWKALHRRYFPVVQAFLRRLGVGRDELDDLTQEVFLRTFRFLKSFRGEAELQTWIYRLCVTATERRHRKRKVQDTLLFWLQRDKTSPETDELVSTPELERRLVEQALNGLSERERAVFVLFELEGVSGKRIAEILKCPEATVWRRLHYARETFRSELERVGVLG